MSINEAGMKKLPMAPAPQPVELAPSAVDQIRKYASENDEFAGKAFRIRVDGGGCAGFRYAFEFDDAAADDLTLTFGDIQVVVDPVTLPYLRGSRVEYHSDLMSSGFAVTNPNAQASCGCGYSFGV